MANGPTKKNLPGLVKRTPQQIMSAISRPDLTTIYQQPQVLTTPTAYALGSTLGNKYNNTTHTTQGWNTNIVDPMLQSTVANTATTPDLYTGSDFSKLSPEQQGAFAQAGGTIGDTGNMIPGLGNNSSWIDGISNYDALQGAAGLGGLALNAYGMFGSGGSMDVNKKNIELMNQQLANNRDLMATRQARAKDISGAFGPKTGLGA